MFSHLPFNGRYLRGLLGLHALVLYTLLAVHPDLRDFATMLGVLAWFGCANSLYYHRCLGHRAFKLGPVWHGIFLFGALAAMMGGPLSYVVMHRLHHAHADTPRDPHSPVSGRGYAYLGWIAKIDLTLLEPYKNLAVDWRSSRLLLLADKRWVQNLPTLLLGGTLWLSGGLPLFLWGLAVPMVLNLHMVGGLVGLFCHTPGLGQQPAQPTRDHARNLGWLGLFSFGEAYHQNHHAYPRRAKMGLAWYEPDPIKYVLWAFERLGWASEIVWEKPGTHTTTPAIDESRGLDLATAS